MKKRIWQYFFIFLLIVIIIIALILFSVNRNIVVVSGNSSLRPIPVGENIYQDAHCGMVLPSSEFAAEVISLSGKTWFFHDPGGVPLWVDNMGKGFENKIMIWFFTMDSKKWKKFDEVWFSINDKTPMGYGFAVYEKKKSSYIRYSEMKLRMLRGENMNDPKVRKMVNRLINGNN